MIYDEILYASSAWCGHWKAKNTKKEMIQLKTFLSY